MLVTPIKFAQNIFSLDGQPLRLPPDSMRHMAPIYNKPSTAMLLKFGRQTHKSTTLGFKISLPCVKYPNYHALYVAPTGNQVSVFSTDKLDNSLHGSQVIESHYFNTQTKDQISYKEFKNNSKIYLRSAFHTADSIRGISADGTVFDEVQDLCSDHISVIEQCMSHSMAKYDHLIKAYPNLPAHLFNNRIYAGTPKTIENTMERYWTQSTQNEWIIKCQHCNRHNYINEYNIGDKCLICNKCQKPIFYENGQWVSFNSTGFIDGYRAPQVIMNWINNRNNPKAWQINVINNRKIYSAEKFYNEILALPYAAASHPMSIQELKACCKDYKMVLEEVGAQDPMCANMVLTAGIDWGKGDTASGTSYSILSIGGYLYGRYKTLFIKRYTGRLSEAVAQIDDMLKIINKFECRLTIADSGDGRTSNAMMVRALGVQKFGEVYEHGSIRQKYKYDGSKGLYILNRSRVMTDRIMEIKRGEIDFFCFDQFQDFVHDFTGIYQEYSEQTRMSIYDHNVPDDVFHANLYAIMASQILRGDLSKYLSGGADPDDGVPEIARSY